MRTRILIVEDDPPTQLVLSYYLRRITSGARIMCVASAEEAYWALNAGESERDPFDLVIADVCLPGSDGLELWKCAQKHHPAVDFLFISGTSDEDWEARISRLPELPNLLKKPITEASLKMFLDAQFNRNT